jgi:RNA-binding protein
MLNIKQVKFLRSLANKLPTMFQVGKDGVSKNQAMSISNALEAHELLKVSVLKNCEAETREVAFDLASATNSEIVQIIGRTITLYRKSKNEGLTEEEVKEQKELRQEYIQAVRQNLRGTLNNVSILNPDGTVTDLSKKSEEIDKKKYN